MATSVVLGILLFAVVSLSALPTEPIAKTESQQLPAIVAPVERNDAPPSPKKVVTYILGHPSTPAIQSPVQLLSPDRYEFYTFDDDGKIIKKLMNIEEIQKIIASSREGVEPDTLTSSGNQGFYQVLNVTPNPSSIQSATNVNPDKPIFSIHDVIASVHNVLKSEIENKNSQPNPTLIVNGLQNAQLISNEDLLKPVEVPQVENLLPESKLDSIDLKNNTKEENVDVKTSTVQEKTTTTTTPRPERSTTIKSTTIKKPIKTTTKKPTTVTKKPQATTKPPTTLKAGTTTTLSGITFSELKSTPLKTNESMIEILKVTSSVSQSSSPISQVPPATTIIPPTTTTTVAPISHTSTTTTTTTTSATKPQLIDTSAAAAVTKPQPTSAAPTVSTTSATTKSQVTEGTTIASSTKLLLTESTTNIPDPTASISQTELPPSSELPFSLLDAHPGFVSNSSVETNSLYSIQNQILGNAAPSNSNDSNKNLTAAESALSEVQFPMNQALAESMSSVISQIASEISMDALKTLEETPSTIEPTTEDATEEFLTTTENPKPTNAPASWLKTVEDVTLFESNEIITTTEEIIETTVAPKIIEFKPQNQPRPFEKPTTDLPTTTVADFDFTTILSDLESRTEEEHQEETTTELDLMATTTVVSQVETNEANNTSEPIQFEKSSLQVIENNGNSTGTIEIIQEAETGRIPRPTQRPEEITTRPIVSSPAVIISNNNNNNNNTFDADFSITTTAESITEPVTSDSNESEQVENISISFLPMAIKSSTAEPEKANLRQSEEELESKIIPDHGEEIVEKSAGISSSHKVVIAAITDEKSPGSFKDAQKPTKPQKPQKPVFIKPTKTKPQDSKPNKHVKPSSDEDQRPYETPLLSSPSALELDQAPDENLGLEATTIHLEPDVRDFVILCNELAFSLWSSITHNGLSFVRSVVVSPFAVTSLLAMVFLGARGPTSGQMNDILKLDDVVTFNPHLVFRNVTESMVIARHPGVATASFVRELYSDRSKGKLLDFYKERAQQFYDGHVEEINFKAVGETLRRQTNHLVKRQTWGKVKDFLQGSTLMLRAPLAAFSANIFQADCSRASTKDRDGEMYFVVLPSSRLRRLVPIPAAVWRDDFLAGYEPNLDATAAAVGSVGGIVSTIFVMPGQQGLIAPGDSLARLEHHLLGSAYKRGHWERLMRSLLRRPGLELQVPRISHKSVVNVTASLVKMGLRDLFSAEKADLTGLNGLTNDLHLSDMVQVNQFSTCGDDASGSQAHTEFYPATPLMRRDKSADNIFAESIDSLFAVSDFEDPAISALPLELRPRQARIPSTRAPDPPRLRLDRPFLFFVRHNPTGLILHVGRFNPRLMH